MGSHALAPPFRLHAPVVLLIAAILALAAIGVGLALALPAGHPEAPAQFQGV